MTAFNFPTPNQPLSDENLNFLNGFNQACRRTILQMLKTSQSGHPGGSLSTLNFLSLLYTSRITQTEEKIVVSNGHISPAVYSVLAECGVVDKQEVIENFRQIGSVFEGHVTRHIPGIYFGTGPLGVGISAAVGYAIAEKLNESERKVFCIIGDGEAQEGQVHEAALMANKEQLNNLIVFCDYNRVQLTDSLEATMPIDVASLFQAHNWEVIVADGHDDEALWKALEVAYKSDRPVMIVGETIMGYGVPMMEASGRDDKADWHGKAPSPDQIDTELETEALTVSTENLSLLEQFRKNRNFKPQLTPFAENLSPMPEVNTGTPTLYSPDTLTDCRSAYGKALRDLAELNPNILAGTADLGGSVMTKFVKADFPDQHLEFGICEQNMVSTAGSLSLDGYIPFVSTFGAFMSSRAKDQARVNDINETNVKMVSTHCGLSVGEDGPTHQAIDDMGSFIGMFNTHVLEPADPNQCDRMIRFASSHWGNFYIRMGRHKLPVLTKPDGSILFDENYQYSYGRCDQVTNGDVITIVASGPMVTESLKAIEASGVQAELIIASSPKKFDDTLEASLKKTQQVIVVEDHNGLSGFASQVALYALENQIQLKKFIDISPKSYQLSGKPAELYAASGIDATAIAKTLESL